MRETISKFTYDEFGKIIANDRSGAVADMTYEYDNLHGWLTNIKGGWQSNEYRFVQNLYRESGSAYPKFNGSISAIYWSTSGESAHNWYDYIHFNSWRKIPKKQKNETPQCDVSTFVGKQMVDAARSSVASAEKAGQFANIQTAFKRRSNRGKIA